MPSSMMDRRDFLRSAAAVAGATVAQPLLARRGAHAADAQGTRGPRAGRKRCGPGSVYALAPHGAADGRGHAKATLDYHWKFKTDIVKVMSDFAYPKPAGNWYELKALENPFPEQIRALELIKSG